MSPAVIQNIDLHNCAWLRLHISLHRFLVVAYILVHVLAFRYILQAFFMPGQQISEDDRQRVDKKFLCSKCELLLIEPMQTFVDI